MRIISGNLKGMVLNTHLRGSTVPMAEKLRSAIFSALGDISGLSVLDGFAGSGSVGIEALSRGAGYAQFIESDSKNHKVLQSNLAATKVAKSKYKATMAGLGDWLRQAEVTEFDLVLLDPPFKHIPWQAVLGTAELVKPGGVLGINMPKSEHDTFTTEYSPELELQGFELAKNLKSGEARYVLLKRNT